MHQLLIKQSQREFLPLLHLGIYSDPRRKYLFAISLSQLQIPITFVKITDLSHVFQVL